MTATLAGVSRTAILTLRARADEHRRPGGVLDDPLAERWWGRVEWPRALDAWYADGAQASLAIRAADIDRIVRALAATTGPLAVVELGAGLSTRRGRLADLDLAAWYDVDLPPVVALREAWGAGGTQLAASVLEPAWLDRLAVEPASTLFLAEGLLYYLPRPEVDALLGRLARRFPGAFLLMDVIGAHDAGKLLRHTAALGCPIAWSFRGDLDAALPDFGLEPVEGFEPARLTVDMLERFWDRLDPLTRGLAYFVLEQPAARAARSGMLLGRLPARGPR